jgi:sterol desaturase/sphingolipid hydroxylase (fatty acid hydroxylase superfamily)
MSLLELDQLPAALGPIQAHHQWHHPTGPADQHRNLGQPWDVLLGYHPDQAPDRHRRPPERRSRSASFGQRIRWQRCSS